MSEPAVFVLNRGGQKNFYADRWAAVFLFREILWGPDEFEKWVTQLEDVGEWNDDASSGVVVDYDQRTLVWTGDDDPLKIPKVASVYERLLRSSWPGYDIQLAPRGLPDLAKAAGVPHAEDYDADVPSRYDSVRSAAGLPDEEDGDTSGDEDEKLAFGEEPRAWITLIGADGAVRHRQVLALPDDLLNAAEGVIDDVMRLEPAEVPPEALVTEGMWIDQVRREIGLWGGRQTRAVWPTVQASWHDWSVRWADAGYAEHCQVSGPCGIPMSDTEALAKFLPIVLSTKRFDVGNVIGVLGSHLKRTAMKATGCLLCAMCFPVVLFGLFSGNWRAALITIGVVSVVTVIVFKVLEFRFKRSFTSQMRPRKEWGADDENRPAVAGPLEEHERRRRVDQLLQAAGFPPLKAIEPSFPKEDALELLQ